jgi:hypothetical protein
MGVASGGYRLSVTAPDAPRTCRRLRLRRISGDLHGSRLRWRRHFPHEGPGIYGAHRRTARLVARDADDVARVDHIGVGDGVRVR